MGGDPKLGHRRIRVNRRLSPQIVIEAILLMLMALSLKLIQILVWLKKKKIIIICISISIHKLKSEKLKMQILAQCEKYFKHMKEADDI